MRCHHPEGGMGQPGLAAWHAPTPHVVAARRMPRPWRSQPAGATAVPPPRPSAAAGAATVVAAAAAGRGCAARTVGPLHPFASTQRSASLWRPLPPHPLPLLPTLLVAVPRRRARRVKATPGSAQGAAVATEREPGTAAAGAEGAVAGGCLVQRKRDTVGPRALQASPRASRGTNAASSEPWRTKFAARRDRRRSADARGRVSGFTACGACARSLVGLTVR
eukprot:148374-Chlamydomonas_euryale.AAC.2